MRDPHSTSGHAVDLPAVHADRSTALETEQHSLFTEPSLTLIDDRIEISLRFERGSDYLLELRITPLAGSAALHHGEYHLPYVPSVVGRLFARPEISRANPSASDFVREFARQIERCSAELDHDFSPVYTTPDRQEVVIENEAARVRHLTSYASPSFHDFAVGVRQVAHSVYRQTPQEVCDNCAQLAHFVLHADSKQSISLRAWFIERAETERVIAAVNPHDGSLGEPAFRVSFSSRMLERSKQGPQVLAALNTVIDEAGAAFGLNGKAGALTVLELFRRQEHQRAQSPVSAAPGIDSNTAPYTVRTATSLPYSQSRELLESYLHKLADTREVVIKSAPRPGNCARWEAQMEIASRHCWDLSVARVTLMPTGGIHLDFRSRLGATVSTHFRPSWDAPAANAEIVQQALAVFVEGSHGLLSQASKFQLTSGAVPPLFHPHQLPNLPRIDSFDRHFRECAAAAWLKPELWENYGNLIYRCRLSDNTILDLKVLSRTVTKAELWRTNARFGRSESYEFLFTDPLAPSGKYLSEEIFDALPDLLQPNPVPLKGTVLYDRLRRLAVEEKNTLQWWERVYNRALGF